jgi:hypothetical protein
VGGGTRSSITHRIDASSSLCRKICTGTVERTGRVLPRRAGGEKVHRVDPPSSPAALRGVASSSDGRVDPTASCRVLAERAGGVMPSSAVGDFGGEVAGEAAVPFGVLPNAPAGENADPAPQAGSPPSAVPVADAGLTGELAPSMRTLPRGVTTADRGDASGEAPEQRGERSDRRSIFAFDSNRVTSYCRDCRCNGGGLEASTRRSAIRGDAPPPGRAGAEPAALGPSCARSPAFAACSSRAMSSSSLVGVICTRSIGHVLPGCACGAETASTTLAGGGLCTAGCLSRPPKQSGSTERDQTCRAPPPYTHHPPNALLGEEHHAIPNGQTITGGARVETAVQNLDERGEEPRFDRRRTAAVRTQINDADCDASS